MEEAAENAQRNEVGLFSPELACTLPGQLQALSAAVDEVPAAVEGDPADALDAAGELVAEFGVLVASLDLEGVRGLGNAVMAGEHVDSYLDDLRETAEDERDRAESARETLDELKTDFDEEQERMHSYGPEISYADDGGYTGERYGMPGGTTFRKCD